MADLAEKLSPLDALAMPGTYGAIENGIGVELSERLCTALVQVQAYANSATTVETALRAAAARDDVIMHTGPARWLVESDTESMERDLRSVLPASAAAVTGLTHARVVVEVSGPKAEWVLASGMALDFRESAFPIGETRLTHHHEIGVTVRRVSGNRFDLYVFTSLARGFWHWITTAAQEVGYRVS